MRFYRLLLLAALAWQSYLTFPDSIIISLFRLYPGATIFTLAFDVLIIGLLIKGLLIEKKIHRGELELWN